MCVHNYINIYIYIYVYTIIKIPYKNTSSVCIARVAVRVTRLACDCVRKVGS